MAKLLWIPAAALLVFAVATPVKVSAESCGDLELDPGEQCDDGNTNAGDGCSPACLYECGDAVVQAGEDCDSAGESAICDDDCTAVQCGDTNINETAGELCDDGNTVELDECSNECLPSPLPSAVTKGQQACINAVNKNLAGVAKVQSADTAACLKAAAAGAVAFGDCYGADAKDKVAKARARTSATFATKCAGENVPTLAFTTPAIVNDAGENAVLEGSTILLGVAPAIALKSDRVASGCQAEALKQYGAVLDVWLAEANKAKKAALKGGKGGVPPPVASATALADAIDAALETNERVSKAVTKAGAGLAKRCTDAVVAASFDCGDATTVEALRACVVGAAQASACGAFEVADGLDPSCPALEL